MALAFSDKSYEYCLALWTCVFFFGHAMREIWKWSKSTTLLVVALFLFPSIDPFLSFFSWIMALLLLLSCNMSIFHTHDHFPPVIYYNHYYNCFFSFSLFVNAWVNSIFQICFCSLSPLLFISFNQWRFLWDCAR